MKDKRYIRGLDRSLWGQLPSGKDTIDPKLVPGINFDQCCSAGGRFVKPSNLEWGERHLLYAAVSLVGGGQIANLGHQRGGSAFIMATALRDLALEGHIDSVDLIFAKSTWNRIVGYEMDSFITLNTGSTEIWGQKFTKQGKLFNLVFVDADHSYEGVASDLLIWSPLVNVGGLLLIHDTDQIDTDRAMREYMELHTTEWEELPDFHIRRIRTFKRLAI